MATIAVIEDNPNNMALMVYLLHAFGHDVVEAADGAEGIALVRRLRPDLVLTDIHLPLFDGFEVARQLKDDPALRRIPLIAVTALEMFGDRERMHQAGFDGYIGKPIDPQRFVGQAEGFLPAPPQRPSVRGGQPAEGRP